MTNTKEYTAADIEDLSDREHVRLRTNVYLGGMSPVEYTIPMFVNNELVFERFEFIPAVYRAIGEIVDNSLDEFSHINKPNCVLSITAAPLIGKYTITDNGRGIPIEQKADRKNKKVWVPELVLSRLRSGRNFKDDKKRLGLRGVNGVGASCTNFCSSSFTVTVNRDNKKYYQQFTNGALKATTPDITTERSKNTGTSVSFQLDDAVFKNISLPDNLVKNKAIEIALTNPGVVVEYNSEKFLFKKGFQELIPKIANGKESFCFNINSDNVVGEVYVILNGQQKQEEQVYTWINSMLLFDGGKFNTQFLNAFFDKTISHLEKEAKKTKSEVTRNDVRQGLLILANLKVENPEYDSQSKTRMTGPDLRKEVVASVSDQWPAFSKSSKEWLKAVVELAKHRFHAKEDEDAIDDLDKKRKQKIVVDNLLDATGTDRSACKLLITEGLSAKAMVSAVRNPTTTAAFALTGKVNNVYGATPAQVLRMGKITDLLLVIGLVPGRKAIRSELNYGQIIISSDSDYDGSDIFTILVNLFYQFWPELFDPSYPPFIYRLLAPNVCVHKPNKRVHFPSLVEFEKSKHKYSTGWSVSYFKGLGSMENEDWEMILNKSDSSCFLPIIDDGHMKSVLQLLFSDDADARKDWLTKED